MTETVKMNKNAEPQISQETKKSVWASPVLLAIAVILLFFIAYGTSEQFLKFGSMIISSFVPEEKGTQAFVSLRDAIEPSYRLLDNEYSARLDVPEAERKALPQNISLKQIKDTHEENINRESSLGMFNEAQALVQHIEYLEGRSKGGFPEIDDSILKTLTEQKTVIKTAMAKASSSSIFMAALRPLYVLLALLVALGVSFYAVKLYNEARPIMKGEIVKRMFLYSALTLLAVLVLFPFFWMLCTSFKPSGQELVIKSSNPFDFVPEEPTLSNFRRVLKLDAPADAAETEANRFASEAAKLEQKKNFGTYFLNSLVVSLSAALLATFIAATGAYAFSKKNFPYKGAILKALIATMLIPGMMFMIPQFFMICKMGLFGTKLAMFLPHLATVFGIFMLKQFMDTIPDSLIEAASMDGASEWQIFTLMIVPLALPVVLTLFLLTFLSNWSNFLWQLIVTDFENPGSITLPVGLAMFRGQYSSELGLIMAGSCFSIVPIAVLFLFAQRYFIEGMTAGAVKE